MDIGVDLGVMPAGMPPRRIDSSSNGVHNIAAAAHQRSHLSLGLTNEPEQYTALGHAMGHKMEQKMGHKYAHTMLKNNQGHHQQHRHMSNMSSLPMGYTGNMMMSSNNNHSPMLHGLPSPPNLHSMVLPSPKTTALMMRYEASKANNLADHYIGNQNRYDTPTGGSSQQLLGLSLGAGDFQDRHASDTNMHQERDPKRSKTVAAINL